MSNIRKQQTGFSVIEGVLLLGVVALIGFLGWTFYQTMVAQDTKTVDDTNTSEVQQESTASKDNNSGEPSVESTADLDEAEKYLNDTDVDDELDTSTIDNALDS